MYTLYSTSSTDSKWKIVNDDVMGGRSTSEVSLDEAGNLSFEGHVSLENNGGFAMCQYHFPKLKINDYSKFILNIKGDGKTYQFRVKENDEDSHYYIASFKTTRDWQILEIPFKDMYPTYRGERLYIPNFSGDKTEMIAFLIGNKKEQHFQLQIESIQLS